MKNVYDDGNIPEIDLPKTSNATYDVPDEFPVSTEPLPESERPRKDGPGGNYRILWNHLLLPAQVLFDCG